MAVPVPILPAISKPCWQNGTHTKPKHVPGTPYWVITNTNTGRKRSMVEHIMQAMQFPTELTEKVCGTI
jgi:negative modulator of initiation of replication